MTRPTRYTLLEAYLRGDPAKLTPERRSAVAADLAFLRDRTGSLRVRVTPAGDSVLLDGIPFPFHEATLVDVGTHALVIERQGLVLRRVFIDVAAGEEAHVDVSVPVRADPSSSPKGEEKTITRLPSPPPVPAGSWLAPAVAWGATGLLGAASSIVHGVAASERGALGDLRREPSTSAARESQARDARSWTLAADVCTAATVAAVGVSLYLTLRALTRAPATVRTTVHNGGLVLSF